MELTLPNVLPDYPTFVEGIRRAPDRGYKLTPEQTEVALKNALRSAQMVGLNPAFSILHP